MVLACAQPRAPTLIVTVCNDRARCRLTGVGTMAGKTPADGEPLAHLYAVMLRLVVITETAGMGGIARAARDAQQELWPVIEYHGGSPLDYIQWQEARLSPPRRPGSGSQRSLR
jgi:hypothetical protein